MDQDFGGESKAVAKVSIRVVNYRGLISVVYVMHVEDYISVDTDSS